ncbi:MAG: sulfurtransferase TusA family protein [Acidimicrobiia bacterium]|nr:sulfurtransferase TusA family protein [Acidimicrobiia bacterium]
MTTETVPVQRLDNRHSPCATGLIRAAKFMESLPGGSRVEILSRDRFAPMEMALWAERDGYSIIETRRSGLWPFRYHRFIVEKSP